MNRKEKVLILTSIAALTFPPAVNAQQHQKRTDPNTYYRAPHSLTGKMIVLPIGTTFEGRLDKSLSSTKSHAGESFAIVLSSPVLSNGVDVIIPAGAQVIGEVVEAISSHSQPHQRRAPLPKGKLRIQISQLRMPDGTSFPLVGNLTGEQASSRYGRSNLQTPLGSSVGFVGTAESFEAVAPGSSRYGKQYGSNGGRTPEHDYVHKRQFLADEIYGSGADDQKGGLDDRRIRSLVLRKMDLFIDAGSPLTVKLQAPLRLAVSPVNSGAPVGNVEDQGGAQDDSLPPPSPKGSGADIPPITDGGADTPPPPRGRGRAPESAAPPPAQPQPQQAPGASPSSDF
jgi:hypothetical protein